MTVTDLIVHVTDGPVHQPNGFYKGRIVRRADMNGFFIVQSIKRGGFSAVHEHNLRILWSDNESPSDTRGAAEVQGPVKEQGKDDASSGSSRAPGCGAMRL